MTRIGFTRLKKLEARRERFSDVAKMTDEELERIVADWLGIPTASIANLSDEELEKLIVELQ